MVTGGKVVGGVFTYFYPSLTDKMMARFIEARRDNQRVSSRYSIVRDPASGLLFLFDHDHQVRLLQGAHLASGSYGAVYEYTPVNGSAAVSVKRISGPVPVRFAPLPPGQAFRLTISHPETTITRALEVCDEHAAIVHTKGVDTIVLGFMGREFIADRIGEDEWEISSFEYSQMYLLYQTALESMARGAAAAIDLGVTASTYQVMERCYGDMAGDAFNQYVLGTTLNERCAHLMAVFTGLIEAATCAGLALTDVKASNMLLFRSFDLATGRATMMPLLGDMGSFTTFEGSGISTFWLPWAEAREDVRPDRFPAALGVFVMYVLYDIIIERLYTEDINNIYLPAMHVLGALVNDNRPNDQRFDVIYHEAVALDAARAAANPMFRETTIQAYSRGLEMAWNVIDARLRAQAVLEWWALNRQ